MRFRLRYLHHDLELTEGSFVIGRSGGCQLSLDDPLVSRRHAVLIVAGDSVTIEDEKSRNGVVVNGGRIAGPTEIRPGDRIVIGSQELRLVDSGLDGEPRGTETLKRTLPKLLSLAPPSIDPRPSPTATASVATSEAEMDPTMVRRAQAFALLSGVAEKALAMGRAEEAERLLSGPLTEIAEASRGGKRFSRSLVAAVARLAAKLATATANGAWFDYVVALYRSQERPCPAVVVDELNAAVRRVSVVDLAGLRDYLALLHDKQATFGPAERFLVQRIEGLERLAALR
ncbi:MAG: FHA domain-containing protein [Polyangiaceae bacterium]|jgi:pSer/pThr/pTyr-binding forkhead associated (FHA) protein